MISNLLRTSHFHNKTYIHTYKRLQKCHTSHTTKVVSDLFSSLGKINSKKENICKSTPQHSTNQRITQIFFEIDPVLPALIQLGKRTNVNCSEEGW